MKKLFFVVIILFSFSSLQAQQPATIEANPCWRSAPRFPYPNLQTGEGNVTAYGYLFFAPFDTKGNFDPSRLVVHVLRVDGLVTPVAVNELQLPESFFRGRPMQQDQFGTWYYLVPVQVLLVQRIQGSHSLAGGYELHTAVIPTRTN